MTNVYPLHPRSRPTVGQRAVYTVKEVAQLLSLSLGSTYVLVRNGTIPARRVGGRWIIPCQRFHDWLNAAADVESAATGTENRRGRW